MEKADTVERGHGHETKFIFSPLQCRTEAKHGYSFAKVACLAN